MSGIRWARGAAALLLVVAACDGGKGDGAGAQAPRTGAEPDPAPAAGRVPRPAVEVVPPPTSPFPLTSLTDDGAWFPDQEIAPPLLPRVVVGPVADRERLDDWDPWPDADERPPAPAAFPDVEPLLEPLAVEWAIESGQVEFSGADAEIAGRLLGALHAALRRTYRVELVAVRISPGAPGADAASLLASSLASTDGPEVLARWDVAVRDGSLAGLSTRDDATWPAGVEVDSVAAHATSLRFGLGAAVVVSPARVDDRRAILRLAFHHTRALGERTIEAEAVDRVAPLLASVSLAVEAPAPEGEAVLAVLDSGDAETSFAVAWRVTTLAAPAMPPGVLARSVHADRALIALVDPPVLGEVDLPDTPAAVRPLPPFDVPTARRDSFLRDIVVVAPGVLVAHADAPVLGLLHSHLADLRSKRLRAGRFVLGRTSLPLIRARGAVALQVRIEPSVTGREIGLRQDAAMVASTARWLVSGRTLRVRAEQVEVAETLRADVTPARTPLARVDGWGNGPTSDVLDAVRTTVRPSSFRLGDAGAPAQIEEFRPW